MELLENCKDFMTINDLYLILPLGKNQIYRLVRNGKIKSKRVGNRYIIPKTALLAFFENI